MNTVIHYSFLLLFIMFSTAARAFSVRCPILSKKATSSSAMTARVVITAPPTTTSMFRALSSSSSSSGDSSLGGTTVVDICQAKIATALEADSVKVTGAFDDPNGSHISIEVVSSKFQGKRPVQRQQLVYKAIWEELQGAVHAVDRMVCKTPDEV